ncbi:hypothetical protein XELAEV_18037266mg [Xenopus laevis]|uniref:GIY-YIG domain-containing protein n=1 Tax=Xenopus laevis TaxID=8355 RepID=A0A974CBV2_XENLA|nr:hypothetical protein XELAEV_18037266mg [Xenopus laevis]
MLINTTCCIYIAFTVQRLREQLIRAKLITSRTEKYDEAKVVLTERFKERGYWPLLQADRQFGYLFNDLPCFCYKRGRTLKETLCPSDTCQKKSIFHGKKKKWTYPCMGCNCCSYIIKGSKINHPKKGYEINLNVYATCKSTHVVYLLKCPCGLGYMGHTSRAVKLRIQEHKEEAALTRPGDDRLLQIEGRWIKNLGTLYLDGLNVSWSLKPYL